MIVEDLVQTFNPQTMISKIKEIIAALDTLNNNIKIAVPNSVGSAVQPVYSNASGVITACTMADQTTTAGLAKIIATSSNTDFDSSGSYVQINGVLIQWGVAAYTNRTVTVTFSRPFSAPPAVASSVDHSQDGNHAVTAYSETSFTIGVDSDLPSTGFIHWVAVGYHS